MIKGSVNKLLLCGFIVSTALLLYCLNESDFYYIYSTKSQEFAIAYGVPSLHNVKVPPAHDSSWTDEEWKKHEKKLRKDIFIRFIDLTGERSKVYSYHQDSKDSLKSEMTLCAEDSIVGFVPRCVTKKIPSKVLDSYLSDYHLELCEIPSVRKANWAKIFIGSFWDYSNPFGFGVERVIVEALSDNSCMNFIHVEVGNYNNYMVKRLLKTFYELRDEMEDAW